MGATVANGTTRPGGVGRPATVPYAPTAWRMVARNPSRSGAGKSHRDAHGGVEFGLPLVLAPRRRVVRHGHPHHEAGFVPSDDQRRLIPAGGDALDGAVQGCTGVIAGHGFAHPEHGPDVARTEAVVQDAFEFIGANRVAIKDGAHRVHAANGVVTGEGGALVGVVGHDLLGDHVDVAEGDLVDGQAGVEGGGRVKVEANQLA